MRVNGLIKKFKLMSKIEDQMAKVLDSTSYLRLRNNTNCDIVNMMSVCQPMRDIIFAC